MNVLTGRMPYWRVDAAALLIAMAAGAGVWYLGIAPTMRARAQERIKAESLAPQQARRDALGVAIARQTGQLEALREEIARSPLRLEPASRINQRIGMLTDMAAETGLEVAQIVPGAPSPGKETVTVTLRLTGVGTFPACNGFLARLAGVHADMAVSGFQMSGNPDDPTGRAAFVFDLAWYAAPEAPNDGREAAAPLQ